MSSAVALLAAITLLMMTSQTMSASLNGGQKSSAASGLQSPQLQDVMTLDDARLLKRSLREELERHFEMLQDAEEDLLQRIEALKVQRQAVSQRKRSHYMCMVNIVACYK